MKISMIAAMAKNRVIGKDKQMPWHLPADLKHFKATTLGYPIIMGRLTYESIGKALPGRKNIVVSSNQAYFLDDAIVVHSCELALEVAKKESDNVMVIGGGKIYESFLAQADVLHLTFIDLVAEGDTQFPDYEAAGEWHEESSQSHKKDEKNAYDYRFVKLLRKSLE